jgi:hypothetical protein
MVDVNGGPFAPRKKVTGSHWKTGGEGGAEMVQFMLQDEGTEQLSGMFALLFPLDFQLVDVSCKWRKWLRKIFISSAKVWSLRMAPANSKLPGVSNLCVSSVSAAYLAM